MQKERVLNYMQEHNGITQKEAMDYIGVGHLPGAIRDLKETGVQIYSEFENSKNRYGEKVSFKRYYLVDENCPKNI